VKFKLRKFVPMRNIRTARNLGIDFGIAPYMVHPKDFTMQAMAVAKRFGTELPHTRCYEGMRNFSRKLIRTEWLPLKADALSKDHMKRVREWLAKTNYSDARKKELLEVAEDVFKLPIEQLEPLKSHIKAEFYTEPKVARWINARCDKAKVLLGPYIKAIEEKVYESHWFIKHVPIPDRPKLIEETLSKFKYIWNNDYTSFEAHMIPDVLRACELQLYSYMLQFVPGGKHVIDVLHHLLPGKNKPKSNMLGVELNGVRMSGEMCTSLGNGFTNLVVMLYVANMKGYDITKINGFVEGDDGIFGCDEGILSNEDFAKVGFITKFEISKTVSSAKFCQLSYDKANYHVITDIRRTLMKFPWTFAAQMHGGPKVMKQLLRAKALSLAYEAPYCPVSRTLANLGLRLTRGFKPIFDDKWKVCPDEAKILELFGIHKIELSTRQLVEEQQHISIETQCRIEKLLDGVDEFGQIDISSFNLFKHEDYHHYEKFVVKYPANTLNWYG